MRPWILLLAAAVLPLLSTGSFAQNDTLPPPPIPTDDVPADRPADPATPGPVTPTPSTPGTPTSGPDATQMVIGNIKSIDGNRVVIKIEDEEDREFTIPAGATLTLNSEEATASDLVVGDTIRVQFSPTSPAMASRVIVARLQPSGKPFNGETPGAVRASEKQPPQSGIAVFGMTVAPAPNQSVMVVSVTPGGPAAEAGIVAGDYIVEVNGRPVPGLLGPAELGTRIPGQEPGDRAHLLIWRDGRTAKFSVTLVQADALGMVSAPVAATSAPQARTGRVWVATLEPGSAAAAAGIQPGDTLLFVEPGNLLTDQTLLEGVSINDSQDVVPPPAPQGNR